MAEYETGSPLWWVARLTKELEARRPAIERATRYYDGDHNLTFASEKFLEAFGGLFRAFSDNWCEVVIDAVEERLNVEGFRVASEVPEADKEAWAIWQRNNLDAQSQLAHQEALIGGAAYAVVWVGADDRAEVTVESSVNTIVACHPKFRDRRSAALRLWLDDDGYEHAELFLPEKVYLFRSKSKRDNDIVRDATTTTWEVDPLATNVDSSGAMPNTLGVVPVVELANRPRLNRTRKIGWGVHSEIRSIMPLQDAVNKLVADMLTGSEFAAFPQRWLTGYEPGVDPESGAQMPPNFRPGTDKLWWLEDAQAKFGQFTAADLSNFVTAIDMVIQHIASISRTPPHYLNASADRLSGESIKAAETGLVAKVKRKQRFFGEAWEEVMRLAGQLEGNTTLTGAMAMETIWSDPETRSDAEAADAAGKRSAIGVPWHQTMEDLGYSPEAIARMEVMRAQDRLLAPAPIQPAPFGAAPASGPQAADGGPITPPPGNAAQ